MHRHRVEKLVRKADAVELLDFLPGADPLNFAVKFEEVLELRSGPSGGGFNDKVGYPAKNSFFEFAEVPKQIAGELGVMRSGFNEGEPFGREGREPAGEFEPENLSVDGADIDAREKVAVAPGLPEVALVIAMGGMVEGQ